MTSQDRTFNLVERAQERLVEKARLISDAGRFEDFEAAEKDLTLENPGEIELVPRQPRKLPAPDEENFEGFTEEESPIEKAGPAANDEEKFRSH